MSKKEYARLLKRGLISDKALRKAKKKFAKKAGHNPPKPEFSEDETRQMEQRSALHKALRRSQDVDTDKFGSPDYREPHDFLRQKIGQIPGAGHNPPKPTYAETESNEQSNESVVETVSRPVAAAAHQLEEWFGKSRKARSGRATMGIRG
jgi:hypothetical protein